MGACDFSTLSIVKGDHRVAQQEACRDARDYNGHQEGYSGDIQTVGYCALRKDNPRYGTKAFQEWEDKILSKTDKREGHCIEITGAPAKRIKDSRGYKGKKGIRVFYFFGVAAC